MTRPVSSSSQRPFTGTGFGEYKIGPHWDRLAVSRLRRTKIVATIGPATSSPKILRELIHAGMDVARLNFSHGNYSTHAETISNLRRISGELNTPVTIMLDLQGPKVRVGTLSDGEIALVSNEMVDLVPQEDFRGQAATIPLDYSFAAEEAKPGMQVLLADGLFELEIVAIEGRVLRCVVVEGGLLKSRKGVNFPNLDLRFPALTEKDMDDVIFGVQHEIDWLSLSFVRSSADICSLKKLLRELNAETPILAKIEKPQAIDRLEEILQEVDGIMVAPGDLGVEMTPEKVPMLQKQIVERCNRSGIPVITATQMLESMVNDPRPTRAEASDVANAIIDGTDAVMLSAETAVGDFPVRAVNMMSRIALEVEGQIPFRRFPARDSTVTHAVSGAVNSISTVLSPRCIAVLTTTGHTAHVVAAERPKALVAAITTSLSVYNRLNLFWGIRPLLVDSTPTSFDDLVGQAEAMLRTQGICASGDVILVIGGVPSGQPRGANFIKIHTLS